MLLKWVFDFETDGYWNWGRIVVLADDYYDAFLLAFRMLADTDIDITPAREGEKKRKKKHRKNPGNSAKCRHVTRLDYVL